MHRRNVNFLIEYLVLGAGLFGVVAAMQAIAARLSIPEATALSILGIGIGASYFAIAFVRAARRAVLLCPADQSSAIGGCVPVVVSAAVDDASRARDRRS